LPPGQVESGADAMTGLPETGGARSLVRSLGEIASYHAHIYYDPAATRAEAERLRNWIGERFSVTLGRWHDVKVGPHDQAMYQVAFAREIFPALVPWLMLNHGRLSVLVHPNTTNPRRDHLADPVWIGPALAVHADKVVIDRKENRHAAFGLGIHRCVGSNLARMEMTVAIEEWLKRIPDFKLDPAGKVTWSEGTVRGPRQLPVLFGS